MTRRSFVVRIWLDEDGAVSGQVSDPLTDWRQPFQDAAQLWALMTRFLVEMPPTTSLPALFHESLSENSVPSDDAEPINDKDSGLDGGIYEDV